MPGRVIRFQIKAIRGDGLHTEINGLKIAGKYLSGDSNVAGATVAAFLGQYTAWVDFILREQNGRAIS